MSDSARKVDGSHVLTPREAALAYIAERRREDPNWDHRADSTYSGLHPTFVQLMSDEEYKRYLDGVAERRRQRMASDTCLQVTAEKEPRGPRPPVRAALPFGQRIRDLRCALGWTQREVALRLGVSARSVIRYEQGRSAPLQSAPLRKLRCLESAHARELDTTMLVLET